MPFLPTVATAIQYRSPPGGFFGHADVITQSIESEHLYIMRTYNFIHIYVRLLILRAGG